MNCLPCVNRFNMRIRLANSFKKHMNKRSSLLVLLLILGISSLQSASAYSKQTSIREVEITFPGIITAIAFQSSSLELLLTTEKGITTGGGYVNLPNALIVRKYDVVLPIAFSVGGEGCPVVINPPQGCKQ